MRIAAGVLVVALSWKNVASFAPSHFNPYNLRNNNKLIKLSSTTTDLTEDDNCGCSSTNTIFSGKLSDTARSLNFREEIRKCSIFSVDGQSKSMDELVGKPNDGTTSTVVFLRSLG